MTRCFLALSFFRFFSTIALSILSNITIVMSVRIFYYRSETSKTLTLDEAPMAYKSLEDIVDVVAESVDIVEVMKPIFNFKATDL